MAGVLLKLTKKLLGTVSLSILYVMGIGLAMIDFSPVMYVAATAVRAGME